MRKDLLELHDLYKRLFQILDNEQDNELTYILNQVKYSIELIEENIKGNSNKEDISNLFNKLGVVYKQINQPRVGLSDYFIWRDDFNDRIMANKLLDEIKEKLFDFFKIHY